MKDPHQILDPKRVKKLIQAEYPDYGKDFSDADWEAIADRLEQLARILWRIANQNRKRDE